VKLAVRIFNHVMQGTWTLQNVCARGQSFAWHFRRWKSEERFRKCAGALLQIHYTFWNVSYLAPNAS